MTKDQQPQAQPVTKEQPAAQQPQPSAEPQPTAEQSAIGVEALVEATRERQASIAAAAAKALGVSANRVCDLLRNVWRTTKGQPALTDQEMFAGLSMIARFNLDPIAKEVYVTRDKNGRLMTIVGIDGWIKILDRTEHYDGFEMDINTNEEGEIRWVECRIHSKTRKFPSVYRAYPHEYETVCGFVAEQMPSHMLRLFALRHAARLFVPIGAEVHLQEEAEFIERQAEREARNDKRGARVSSLNS